MRPVVVAERETAFEAAVRDGQPHRWTALDTSLDVSGTLRLLHIAYLPPVSLAELAAFEAARGRSASAVGVHSVRAIVRTITASRAVEEFVVACFALDVQRLSKALTFTVPSPGEPDRCGGDAPIAARPSTRYSIDAILPPRPGVSTSTPTTFVMPCASDIAAGLNIRLALDGFTELRVEGPGTVVFSGEQRLTMVSQRTRDDHSR
ncbi:hypothetical protein NESM_000395400 [Novymonas esmeraldas]|uniref:Uncharacterized protein n=1 Tax=Novymonas esmeraldas TaxID=1808958 RepID=A0AAW0EM72_9TRYP